MACQPSQDIQSFEARTHATRRRVKETELLIRRIEAAKEWVCGVPSPNALTRVQRYFEALLPQLEEHYRWLNRGSLDTLNDLELRQLIASLQERHRKLALIHQGALRIGLGAVEPFPRILSELKAYQDRLDSQIEGILLSLNDSFQELAEKSAQELKPAGS